MCWTHNIGQKRQTDLVPQNGYGPKHKETAAAAPVPDQSIWLWQWLWTIVCGSSSGFRPRHVVVPLAPAACPVPELESLLPCAPCWSSSSSSSGSTIEHMGRAGGCKSTVAVVMTGKAAGEQLGLCQPLLGLLPLISAPSSNASSSAGRSSSSLGWIWTADHLFNTPDNICTKEFEVYHGHLVLERPSAQIVIVKNVIGIKCL